MRISLARAILGDRGLPHPVPAARYGDIGVLLLEISVKFWPAGALLLLPVTFGMVAGLSQPVQVARTPPERRQTPDSGG